MYAPAPLFKLIKNFKVTLIKKKENYLIPQPLITLGAILVANATCYCQQASADTESLRSNASWCNRHLMVIND